MFTHRSFPRVPSFMPASVTASAVLHDQTVVTLFVSCTFSQASFRAFSLVLTSSHKWAPFRRVPSLAQSPSVASAGQVGPPLLNSLPNSAHLWAAPSPGQASLVDGGRTVWRLLPSAVHPPGCCVGGMLFTPSLAWESASLSTLLPVTRPSPHTPQPSSPPFTLTIPPTSPYIPVVPPPSPVRLPYLCSSPYLPLLAPLPFPSWPATPA